MKYRKKPVVIEAMQFRWDTRKEVRDFINDGSYGGEVNVDENGKVNDDGMEIGLIIKTLEGDHLANAGDYIIKGVKGEFYPCKPDIFEMTYEKVFQPEDSSKDSEV